MSMKTATFKELQRQTAACIEAAQDGPVIITRYGQPVGLLTGIKGYDWEDVYYMTNKAFRREIERARAQPARPIEEVWDELYDGE